MDVFFLNEQLINCLKEKYGDFTPVPLSGGYTNETFLLKGTTPSVIAKLASLFNGDIQNEKNALLLLNEAGIGPKFYEFIETDENQITIMEFRLGQNGQSIMDHNEIKKTKELYKNLGTNLARNIHSIKYDHICRGIRESNVHELNYDLDFVPETLIIKSKEFIHTIREIKTNWVLTHGDYGIHNVLYSDAQEVTAIDWEWAEWGNPLNDIAWVCWFTRLHYSESANVLNSLFTNEYIRNMSVDLSSKNLKAHCIYKVWKILSKVKNAPQEVQQEWLRRLAWTIETDIFDFLI